MLHTSIWSRKEIKKSMKPTPGRKWAWCKIRKGDVHFLNFVFFFPNCKSLLLLARGSQTATVVYSNKNIIIESFDLKFRLRNSLLSVKNKDHIIKVREMFEVKRFTFCFGRVRLYAMGWHSWYIQIWDETCTVRSESISVMSFNCLLVFLFRENRKRKIFGSSIM